jgi:CHAD domain-containing protein
MGRALELILRIEPGTAKQWAAAHAAAAASAAVPAEAGSVTGHEAPQAKKRVRRAAPRRTARDAMTEALRALPGATCVAQRTPATRRLFAGTPCVVVEEAPDGCRVVALRREALVPGVRVCQTVFEAPLDASGQIHEQASWPAAVRAALDAEGEQGPPRTVQFHRETWEWAPSKGPSIKVVALDAAGAEAAQADTVPQCELHLSIDLPSTVPPDDMPAALRALFAGASAIVKALPAFPVLDDLFSCDDPAREVFEPVRATRVDLGDARTPHEALLAIGGHVARQWFGNAPGVRERSAPEFVHQMRVALRRLKTLIKTFSHWADADWLERVAPELDWLGELLGTVRDLDVFAGSTLPALANADTDASRWQAIRTAADARRGEARSRLQSALRSPRYAALSLLWLEWFALQSTVDGPDAYRDTPIGTYAAKRVRKHYKRLTAKPPLTELDAPARHRRRIAAKRLRYTLEYFESLASTKTRRRVAKQLGRIQSVLGDGSDAATALRFLDALEAPPYQAGFARGWCEAINRSSAQEAQRLLVDLKKPKIVGRRGR